MNYIGIDIGGMSIKGGIVSSAGEILKKEVVTTNPWADDDVIVGDIASLIKSLIGDGAESVKGIGLGIPGTVDGKKGRVSVTPNINLTGTCLVKKLHAYFPDVPIKISNDANCAALGEALFGSEKLDDAVLVTLGTGVGTGIILDGKLFEGNGGAGAEGGHMVIKTGGEKCGCGRRGCWEAYASASALIRQTRMAADKNPDSILAKIVKEDGEVNGKTVFKAQSEGCPVAQKVIKKYLVYVGDGIVNLVNIFRPKAVIVGGGISKEGERIIKPLQAYVNRKAYAPKFSPKVKVMPATLFNDAGIIGAAALVMDN